MADPRIQRTRTHVLEVARRMLSEHEPVPLTFTSLANEAQVSRRTLYTHWGSIDKLIGEAVSFRFTDDRTDLQSLPTDERVISFLRLARDRMSVPLTAVAFALLISRAVNDETAAQALSEIAERGRAEFTEHVGPISAADYEFVIGPIFHAAFVARSPLTDDQLHQLAGYVAAVVPLEGSPV